MTTRPPLADLLALWMSDDPADLGADTSGASNDLTLINSPSAATGPTGDPGTAIQMAAASSQTATIATKQGGVFLDDISFSISMFVRKDDLTDTFSTPLAFGDDFEPRILVRTSPDRTLFQPSPSNDGVIQEQPGLMADTDWHHVVWSFDRGVGADPNSNKGWYDGQPLSQGGQADLSGAFPPITNVTLGANKGGTTLFSSFSFAQVAVFEGVLTADEVAWLRNEGQGISGIGAWADGGGGSPQRSAVRRGMVDPRLMPGGAGAIGGLT